jgi:hypothetical protein
MTLSSAATLSVVISPKADRLAAFLVANSLTAVTGDPEYEYDGLLAAAGMSAEELADAADDLAEHHLVETDKYMNGRRTPFDVLAAKDLLFAAYDGVCGLHDPERDARQVAIDLHDGVLPHSVSAAASHYGWPPRRMNPAVTLLVARGLVQVDDLLGAGDWCQHGLAGTRQLRRFVQEQD